MPKTPIVPKRSVYLFLIFFFLSHSVFSQDAPGGIGNATGSDGQPRIKLWLIADSLNSLSDGYDVTSWDDFSGNGNNLDGSDKPPVFEENTLNGHHCVAFQDDLSRIIKEDFSMPTEAVSIFYVLQAQEDPEQHLCPFSYEKGTDEYVLFEYPNDGDFNTFVKDGRYDFNFDYADGQWKILSHQWRSSDGRLLVHANGAEKVNDDHQYDKTLTTGGTLSIGAEQDGENSGYHSDEDFEGGKIAEFIMYGSSLKQAQRNVVENYLAQKYGLDGNLSNDLYVPDDPSYTVSLTGMGQENDGITQASCDGFVITENGSFHNGEYLMTAHDGSDNQVNASPATVEGETQAIWSRNWYVDKTGSMKAKMAFDMGEGIDGDFPANIHNYRLMYKSPSATDYDTVDVAGKGVQNSDQIYFEVEEAQLADGYYTLGTVDRSGSPLKGVASRTWYTLISGEWNNPDVWTLDPSGALPNNPNGYTPSTSPTSDADNVVILSGKTVTVTNSGKNNNRLTVKGRLKLQGTSGHAFSEIRGSGKILLSGDHFPSGDASHFVSKGQGEGTVEYYGGSYELDQPLEFYNLEINLNSASETLTLLEDYTINGGLRITRGQFQINNGSANSNLSVTVHADLMVENNGSILTGAANARHQLNLYGDLTNRGTVEFTNRTSANYNDEATNGIVDANFLHDTRNQKILCDGTTNFYRIEIDKGNSDTYGLSIESNNPAYFNLYGYANEDHGEVAQLSDNANALGLIRGTVRIKDNVDIPVLSQATNYNISESARLWVDGGTVFKNDGNAIVPYGKIRVSEGTLEARVKSGITTRGNGLIKVEGGTLTTNQIRTSIYGDDNVGGYVQSGGTVNILGGNTNTDYYAFTLTYPGNVFNMSGGTLHIHEAHGKGGIFIASDQVNQNVTGGTVIAEIDDGENFPITSKAPFWNLIIRNANGGTARHVLTGGDNVGSTDENLPVQDLHVLHDLTIETGTTRTSGSSTYGSYLDLVPDNTNAADLFVGGDLRLEDHAVLDVWAWDGTTNDDANAGSATVTFNRAKDAVLYVGDITTYTRDLMGAIMNISNNYLKRGPENWQLPFYNLTIDKPGATLSLAAKKPGKGREIFQGGEWSNTPNPARNSTNGGKNVTGYASRLLLINEDFKLQNGTLSQIDPFHNVTTIEDDGGDWGSVGDPVAYGMMIIGSTFVNQDTCFVYNPGSTPKEGTIEFLSSETTFQTIQTSEGSYFGNFRMNTEKGGGIQLTSDVHMGRLEYGGGVLDIGKYELKLDAMEFAATNRDEVSSGQFYFDENHYIRMDGNASDGGLSIKLPRDVTPTSLGYDEYKKVNEAFYREDWYHDNKEYNQQDYFWFLIGTDASGSDKYTPAICHFHNSGTTDGDEYVNINVVDGELETTDLSGGDLLSYYWNVDYEGFEGSDTKPEVSWLFQYDESDGTSEANYVPGKVLDVGDYNRSDEGGVNAVKNGGASDAEGDILGNNPRNIVVFNGVGSSSNTDGDDDIESATPELYDGTTINPRWQDAWPNSGFTLEKANYTAGEAARFTGSPPIYYNRGIGDRNWDNTSKWSTVSHSSSTNSGSYPQAGDIVKISNPGSGGDGRVTVPSNYTAEAALVEFNDDAGDSWGHRIKISTNATANFDDVRGDVGELYFTLSTNSSNAAQFNGDIGDFAQGANSTVVYRGDYNQSGPSSNRYKILPVFPQYPNIKLEGSTLFNTSPLNLTGRLWVANVAVLEAEADIFAEGRIDVFHGSNLFSRLRFGDNVPGVTISCDYLRIGGGRTNGNIDAFVDVIGAPSSGKHELIVNKQIEFIDVGGRSAYSYLDLFDNSSDYAILKLTSSNDGYLNTLAATNNVELHSILMDKGSDTTSFFTFNSDFTLNGPTSGIDVDKALDLQNGKLILNDPNIDIDLTTGDDDFYIPGSAALEVRQGQVKAGGNSGILLDGALEVTGGTVDMSGGDNYIEYSASGDASIRVTGGQLTVGSQIRRGLTSTEGILNYQQSGGTVIVGNDAAPENNRGVFEILNDGSRFAHTGGDLYIARAQDNPSIASLYLDPQTIHFGEGSFIRFGHNNTPTDEVMGIYSTVDLPNVVVDNVNGTHHSLQQWTGPLTVSDSLEIDGGVGFNAQGRDLILKGDMVANGTFDPGQNTTYFSGTTDQKMVGGASFWNLTKDQSNTLTLDNADMTVSNELRLEAGTFDDGGHTLHAKGNVWMDATHTHGGSGEGIAFDGNRLQMLRSNEGDAFFGQLTINNSGGADSIAVSVPRGNDIHIQDTLKMKRGVFDIGKNLLVLDQDASILEASPFSTHNMIQTNISFTDIGVKKYFPEITSSTRFTYPIGSGGKYTPVIFDITDMDAGGSIRVKAADEIHPTITNDDEPCDDIIDTLNVLKYHWLVEAEGVSHFSGQAWMNYVEGDVQIDNTLSGTSYEVSDYITARLLLDSPEWNKYDPAGFQEANQRLHFTFSGVNADGISGDYTAGVEDQDGTCKGAIPDKVPAYVSTQDGNWTEPGTWDTYPSPGGSIPAGGPRGAIVVVEHQVDITKDYITNYKTTIDTGEAVNGLLNVNGTYGHRLGIVEGVGTLRVERGDLPAGIYEEFFSADGGTLEYGGNSDYDVLGGISQLNNLVFSGTGERRLANRDVGLYGNLDITGSDNSLQVINEHDQRLSVEGDITFTRGSFDAGSGSQARVRLNGNSRQRITGNFRASSAFNHLKLNNDGGMEVIDSVEVDENFSLLDGMVYLPDTALVTLNSTASDALSGASSSQYIQGPLRKRISGDEGYTFPVGDTSRYGKLELVSNSASSPKYWQVQYFNNNPHVYGYDTSSRVTDLEAVSGNEFWMVKGPGNQTHVKIRWDDQSVLPAETDNRSANLRIAEYLSGEWKDQGSNVTDNGVNSGFVQTDSRVSLEEHPFTLATTEDAPEATASFYSSDTTVCEGNAIELVIKLTGEADWNLEIYKDGSSWNSYSDISSSSFTITISGATLSDAGTYSIHAIEDQDGPGNVYGGDVHVTVSEYPKQYEVGGGGTICSDSSAPIGLTSSQTGVEYELYDGGSTPVQTVSGTGDSITFGYYSTQATYTVEAVNSNGCRIQMSGSASITVHTVPDPEPYPQATQYEWCYENALSVQLYAGDGGGYAYSWTPTGDLDDPSAQNPYYEPGSNPGSGSDPGASSDTTWFEVEVNNNGCVGVDSLRMILHRQPQTGQMYHVPNDFDLK